MLDREKVKKRREKKNPELGVMCMLVKGCAVSLTNRNALKLLTGN